MSGLEKISPMAHIGSDSYIAYWQLLFNTVLSGFWAKGLAFILLVLAFWFGVRLQQVGMGAIFFLLAIIVTYSYPLMHLLGLI